MSAAENTKKWAICDILMTITLGGQVRNQEYGSGVLGQGS